MLAEMNSTAGLGPVAAIGIAVAFVVMVTLLPALLVICGRWVFWPQGGRGSATRAHGVRDLGPDRRPDRATPRACGR